MLGINKDNCEANFLNNIRNISYSLLSISTNKNYSDGNKCNYYVSSKYLNVITENLGNILKQ